MTRDDLGMYTAWTASTSASLLRQALRKTPTPHVHDLSVGIHGAADVRLAPSMTLNVHDGDIDLLGATVGEACALWGKSCRR